MKRKKLKNVFVLILTMAMIISSVPVEAFSILPKENNIEKGQIQYIDAETGEVYNSIEEIPVNSMYYTIEGQADTQETANEYLAEEEGQVFSLDLSVEAMREMVEECEPEIKFVDAWDSIASQDTNCFYIKKSGTGKDKGELGLYAIKAADQYMPTVIRKIEDKQTGTFTLLWLYDSVSYLAEGTKLSEDSLVSYDEMVGITGAYVYLPAPPHDSITKTVNVDDAFTTIGREESKKLMSYLLADDDQREWCESVGGEIPVEYDLRDFTWLLTQGTKWTDKIDGMERDGGQGEYFTGYQPFFEGDQKGIWHTGWTGAKMRNYKEQQYPTALTFWHTNQASVQEAAHHFGCFIYEDNTYFNPRWVYDYNGKTVAGGGFPMDAQILQNNGAIVDKESGLMGLYKQIIKDPWTPATWHNIEFGSVNNDWVTGNTNFDFQSYTEPVGSAVDYNNAGTGGLTDAAQGETHFKKVKIGDKEYWALKGEEDLIEGTNDWVIKKCERARILIQVVELMLGKGAKKEVYFDEGGSFHCVDTEGRMIDRGLFDLYERAGKDSALKNKPYMTPTEYSRLLEEATTDEQVKLLKECLDVYKLSIMLTYFSISGYPLDPEEVKKAGNDGVLKNGNYIVIQTRASSWYKTYTSPKITKIVNKDEILLNNNRPKITKDLVLGDTQESNTLGDSEYYGTNLWTINEDVSDTDFLNIIGITKTEFNAMTSWNITDISQIDKYSNTARINSIGKEDFEKCFSVVDAEEGIMPNTVYILQSTARLEVNIEGLETEGDPAAITGISSYNDNIHLAWNETAGTETSGFGKETITGMTEKRMVTEHSSKYWMPNAIDNTNDGTVSTAMWERFVKAAEGTAYSTEAGIWSLKGNAFTPIEYTRDDEENSEYYKIVEDGEKIRDGWNDADQYRNSTKEDEENKYNNVKIYRTVIKPYLKADSTSYTLQIYFYNPDGAGKSGNDEDTVYSNYNSSSYSTMEEKENAYIDMLFNLYILKYKNLTPDPENEQDPVKVMNDFYTSLKKDKGEESTWDREIKIEFLDKLFKSIDQNTLTEAGEYKWNYEWLLGDINTKYGSVAANTTTRKGIVYSDNDNGDNDCLKITYAVNPKVEEQRNLMIEDVTILRCKDGENTWTEYKTISHASIEAATKNKEATIDIGDLEFGYSYQVTWQEKMQSFYADTEDPEGSSKQINQNYNSKDEKFGNDNSLYMYAGLGLLNPDENTERFRIYPDTCNGSTIPAGQRQWNIPDIKDSSVGLNLDGALLGFTEKATAVTYNKDFINNSEHMAQIISGKYFKDLPKESSNGKTYVSGTYIIGIPSHWSNAEDDTKNNNTANKLPSSVSKQTKDPEKLTLKFRFVEEKDFDNAITEVFIVTQNGTTIPGSDDCMNPAAISDIDIGNLNSSIMNYRYQIGVKVQRMITNADVKNVGSQCKLYFTGNLFGYTYTVTDPAVFTIANNIPYYSGQLTNCGNTLKNNGDYMTYAMYNVQMTESSEICGTFYFEHYDEEKGTTSDNDKDPTNNVKDGAWAWGTLDYWVHDFEITGAGREDSPLYATEENRRWPQNSEGYITFSGVFGLSLDGSAAVISNDFLFTNIDIVVEMAENVISPDWQVIANVCRIDNAKIPVNSSVTLTGKVAKNRILSSSFNEISSGSMIYYDTNKTYRLVARINGGNAASESVPYIHEVSSRQTVKLETEHYNNRAIAGIFMKNIIEPVEKTDYCPERNVRNDWGPITFSYYECTQEQWVKIPQYDKDRNITGYKDECISAGCGYAPEHTTDKDFYETYEMHAYVASTANNWQWTEVSGAIEIRAGEEYQVKVETVYYTNRGDMPPRSSYGGCAYLRRTPEYYSPSATRTLYFEEKNTASGDTKKEFIQVTTWSHTNYTTVHQVPETTGNITIHYKLYTKEFWGYGPEKPDQQKKLCDCLEWDVKITGPLPLVEGNQEIT